MVASKRSQPAGVEWLSRQSSYPLRYLPTYAVRYPAFCSHTPMLLSGSFNDCIPPQAPVLECVPLLWVYSAVTSSARAEQHSGFGENDWRNVTPDPPSRRQVLGRYLRSSARMSSVRNSTMSG